MGIGSILQASLPQRASDQAAGAFGERPGRSMTENNPVPGAIAVAHPAGGQSCPLVVSSPHSGNDYSDAFLRLSLLDPLSLRRSEDSFVDILFDAAPGFGAVMIKALFPRAYVDVNREPYELDPAMFRDPLPPHANTRSLRVLSGLGTIARVVADGAEIYGRKLPFAEAEHRIAACYRPFHDTLETQISDTVTRFGGALLIDCHSMPSLAGPVDPDPRRRRPDIVLGDRFGMSCAPEIVALAETTLRDLGYRVGRNDPYAGGFITHHYGRPAKGRHALQIEINRGLYMDEAAIAPNDRFAMVKADMHLFLERLAAVDSSLLKMA